MPPAAKQARPAHRCGECGTTVAKWVGRCPECQAWGTVVEVAPPRAAAGLRTDAAGVSPLRRARSVADVVADTTPRTSTGLGELDRVLGGGLVAGQVVLLAGEPGVGKSTLLAAAASAFAERQPDRVVLYVSGEESVEQIGVRARRIGATSPGVLLADETDISSALGHVEAHDPALLIVDSVQAMASSAVDGRAGGVSQVQEVTQLLVRTAKARRMPLLLVGQSTRENAVAGPRALEHMVDTVLAFEGDRSSSLRLLRSLKNRYGPADEVVCFEQTDRGLREVADPSDLFRSARELPVPGTAVTIAVDGRRALPTEVQALVTASSSPSPRRGTTGLDASRVAMLLAVTERATGHRTGDKDVFLATVGGARITDPSADLAICLALASATLDIAVPNDVAVIGEVALSGDVRSVRMLSQRLAEAARCGYRQAVVPRGSRKLVERLPPGLTAVEVSNLDGALEGLARMAAAPPPRPVLTVAPPA